MPDTFAQTKRAAPAKYTPNISLKDRIFFIRLLFRWRDSVWQLLWLDLAVFISLYIVFNALYHFILSSPGYESYKHRFENFVEHVQKIATNTPLSFLLGFFVSAALARWWQVCTTIPWISRSALLLHSYIVSIKHRDVARKTRLNILRYMNLAWIMAMKPLSQQIFQRFALPSESTSDFQKLKRTMDDIVTNTLLLPMDDKPQTVEESSLKDNFQKINDDPHVKKTFGELITDDEVEIFTNIARQSGEKRYKGEYWIPLQWCTRILVKARDAKLMTDDISFHEATALIDNFRSSLGSLGLFNDINIPLVYTQVILVAIYSFFMAEVFSSQLMASNEVRELRINGSNTTIEDFKRFDNFVPLFSIFKFIFFMGWFKTAISLLNPLGRDNHDFPSSLMLDYNLKMSMVCGGAGNELYPRQLYLEGDPLTQLDTMKDFFEAGKSMSLETSEAKSFSIDTKSQEEASEPVKRRETSSLRERVKEA